MHSWYSNGSLALNVAEMTFGVVAASSAVLQYDTCYYSGRSFFENLVIRSRCRSKA